jgi:hypothetical protein
LCLALKAVKLGEEINRSWKRGRCNRDRCDEITCKMEVITLVKRIIIIDRRKEKHILDICT